MTVPLREVIAGRELRTRFADSALVGDYLDAGSPSGELIYLGFGESWTEVAPGLVAHLTDVPLHAHGYVISQYGLPRLQRTLRDYIATTHRLPEPGGAYEVAVSCGGTRNAMFDFARLLRTEGGGAAPVALAPMPGWDYAGVLEPLGYRMQYMRAGDGTPTPAGGIERPALVVINAQHNPTGANWSPDAVRRLIRLALDGNAAILIDDAYFGVHDPSLTPTSALRLLLEQMADAPPPARRRWLAVRSLGKQFHCNGWGIGALAADPATLDTLVNELQFQRSFASAIPLQAAMAAWLDDPAAERFLERTGRDYTRKRAAVEALLYRRMGYPRGRFQLGECGPYVRIQVPPGAGSVEAFRRRCLHETGVLVGVDRFVSDAEADDEPAWYRIFLGPPLGTLTEGLRRLAAAGHGYRERG